MSEINKKMLLKFRERAFRNFEKALKETLKNFNDLKNNDSAIPINHLQSSFKKAIDGLANHFCDYQSSLGASQAMLVEALPDVEAGTSSRHSGTPSTNKAEIISSSHHFNPLVAAERSSSSQPNNEVNSKKLLKNGYRSNNVIWEKLEYLGDRVLTSCLLKISGPRYLNKYQAKDIFKGVTNIVTNKILAAYSITLSLDRMNDMKFLAVKKYHADAFEAYFGAYYLASGELATCQYLESLMTPLLDIILEGINAGQNNLELINVSPFLGTIKSPAIAMPGIPYYTDKETIQLFDENFIMLLTKTKPKKLVLLESDGQQYGYLFKGHEDLHLYERIMQLLRITSDLLKRNNQTHARSCALGKTLSPQDNSFGFTQNIETVLGVTGVERVFRITCENVLRVLRENKEILNLQDFTIMHPF
ncbi:45052_t:CDS:2 [Gigaspora margarita]|uniref:45052_t:CDS:1 n=1 Tax=Gigaspora margarita TaxID=4874 RepID=A0ABN7UXW7_GIGMA|nr:45052_t:CDS:2 [Gigaspora margarita]